MILRSEGGSTIENFPNQSQMQQIPSKCDSNLKEMTALMQNHRNLQSKVSFLNQDDDDGLPLDQNSKINRQSNELAIKVVT